MKLLELFFGSRSERDLLQEAKGYRKKGRPTKHGAQIIKQADLISRRQLLWRAVGTGAILIPAGSFAASLLTQNREDRENRADFLTDEPEVFRIKQSTASYHVQSRLPSRIDEGYVNPLFDQLSSNRGFNPNKRLDAVLNSLSIVTPKEKGGYGSAVKICESGYFITACHNFFNLNERGINLGSPRDNSFEIYNPKTGIYSDVKSLLVVPGEDLAIAYAPTDRPREAVEGLKLDFTFPPTGTRLWNMAITPSNGKLMLGVVSGKVSKSAVEFLGFRPDFRAESMTVDGLKPYGGSSGGSTVNGLGEVVGLELGAIPGEAQKREDYTAALIGPLHPLRGKLQSYVFASVTS